VSKERKFSRLTSNNYQITAHVSFTPFPLTFHFRLRLKKGILLENKGTERKIRDKAPNVAVLDVYSFKQFTSSTKAVDRQFVT